MSVLVYWTAYIKWRHTGIHIEPRGQHVGGPMAKSTRGTLEATAWKEIMTRCEDEDP